eukprot:15442221-Alexandrium_andersonii.AAC.1
MPAAALAVAAASGPPSAKAPPAVDAAAPLLFAGEWLVSVASSSVPESPPETTALPTQLIAAICAISELQALGPKIGPSPK